MLAKSAVGNRYKVVMLVVSNFPRDNRVQKSARSVTQLGHDVTVIWAHPSVKVRDVRDHGDFKSIGLPLDYSNRRMVQSRKRVATISRASSSEPTVALRAVRQRYQQISGPFAGAMLRWNLKRGRLSTYERELHDATAQDIHNAFFADIAVQSPDVIHVQDIHPILTAFAMRDAYQASLKRQLPIIFDAHEYVAGQVSSNPSSAVYWESVQRRLIDGISAISTVCEPIAERLQSDYSLASRPLTILNVPEIDQPREIETIRTKCLLDAHTPLVVYSGSIAPQRGVMTAVRAIAEIPDAHLAIICVPSTKTAAARSLRELVLSLGVQGRVHLLEPVEPDQIVEFLKDADVGVHPLVKGPINHELALPNKLFDYIHSGLTLAVSDVEAMSRFVNQNGLGTVFESENPLSCKLAIQAALIGRRSGEFSSLDPGQLKKFTWADQFEQFNRLYAKLGA